MPYPFDEIEPKWQQYWDAHETFRTSDDLDASKPKYYVLDMFPYPSGAGLHVGHPEGYTATDILARYKRMNGFNVLHPMGWDAFGLPAEQYAVETGTHPRLTTEQNINRFREQLKALGFSYDWSREVNTTDLDYVRWTQWIFLKLYEKGLAYLDDVPVNWCPALGTVLANEEVIDGKSERGGHPVVRRPMRQWMLKITHYAERLLDGLDDLDWSDSLKEMQRNWIGKSEGAEVVFGVFGDPAIQFRVFTTRPDTLFGATYLVLAPEHPMVDDVTTPEHMEAVLAYQKEAERKSELERTELQKEKTGVFTGAFAINPANGFKIPIWVADYVLAGYGTGAIMAVPGHDQRDFEFAQTFGLPIHAVVAPTETNDFLLSGGDGPEANADKTYEQLVKTYARRPHEWPEAYVAKDGVLINSDASDRPISNITTHGISLNGLSVPEAIETMTAWLENEGQGTRKVNYKLRDWLFSRQRYWGEPFPVIYVGDQPKPLPVSELPVRLPEVERYEPSGTGESPLATIEDWLWTTDPETGQKARRETNTMPQWAGSCWYYLRYIDPRNDEHLVDPAKEKYWMPVDLYVGGAEHAVLHLLYARFWHKVLFDAGVVSTDEPFRRLVNQGMILGEQEYTVYRNEAGAPVSAQHASAESTDARNGQRLQAERVAESDVEKRGDHFVLKSDPEVRVAARAHKMSKSRGNVINPDDVIEQYGADALRLYEMFMGPLEQTKPWSMKGVEGVYRFLNRVWRLFMDEETGELAADLTDEAPSKDHLRTLHATIQKVTDDVEGLRFNTAIAAMMEFTNAANKWATRPRAALEPFVLLLAPFAPHLAEELWQKLGHADSLAYADWPTFDEAYLKEDEIEVAVQVNGKVRGTITVAADADKGVVLNKARSQENVARYLQDTTVRREIYVPGRLVNFVVG